MLERTYWQITVWKDAKKLGDTLEKEYKTEGIAKRYYLKAIDSGKYEGVTLRKNDDWTGGSCSCPIRIWAKGKWGVYHRYTGIIAKAGVTFKEAEQYVNSKLNPSEYEIYEK